MQVELTEAEALVLSDWLYRNSKKELFFDDLAEQYVLWSIESQLEKKLEGWHGSGQISRRYPYHAGRREMAGKIISEVLR